MKPLTFFGAALLLVAVPLTAVNAARFERGDIVTVAPQELVSENIYLAGGQVTFSSTAQKDVVAAGGKVLQNGAVWGDVIIAGGTVDVIEDVRGDVRVAGGQVTIQGMIGGDVTVAGGAVTILPGTTIAGDLVAAGGAVFFEGTVSGQTKIYGGEVVVNGMLAGPVHILVQEKVSFGEKAVIGSTLTYRAPQEAEVASGAKLGDKVTFTPLDIPDVDRETIVAVLIGLMTAFFIAKTLALMLASGVAVSYFPTPSRGIVDTTIKKFWQSLGMGLAALILTPILGVVLMATVLGMYFGFFVFILYGLVLLVSGVYLGVVAGAILARLIRKEYTVSWKWAVLGTLVVSLLSLTPFVGWLLCATLFLATLGAVSLQLVDDIKAKRS